jgi:hypothetical protein
MTRPPLPPLPVPTCHRTQGLAASAAKTTVRWDAVQRAVDAEERRIAALEEAGTAAAAADDSAVDGAACASLR